MRNVLVRKKNRVWCVFRARSSSAAASRHPSTRPIAASTSEVVFMLSLWRCDSDAEAPARSVLSDIALYAA